VRPQREAHGAGQTPASPHGTAPRRNRDAGTVSPRQSIVTRMGQDRLRGSVKRSGIARWSRHYWPRTFASLPLGTSHHRSAVRPGKPARPIMTSTARSASSSCRRGPEPATVTVTNSLLPLARGALRLSVMTTWQVSPSDEAQNAKREATAMRSRLLRVGRGIGLLPDGVEVSGICGEAAKGEAAGFASGLAEAQATSRSR
jgi:hypothetical protein